MSRLTIDITPQQHQTIKATAALLGKSIKEYALERLFPENVADDQALKNLLDARLSEVQQGQVIAKSVTAIAEEVIDAERK